MYSFFLHNFWLRRPASFSVLILSGTLQKPSKTNRAVIDSVDEAQFNVDETKKLTLLDVAMGKVTGLSDALEGKVDKVEGSRLITSEEATKLEGIATGAEVNAIESVDETQFALDDAKKLTLLDVAMGKVTGLTEALAGKVNAIDGSRLMTEAEGTKLAGVEVGAQVNIIDAVSTVDGTDVMNLVNFTFYNLLNSI